MVAILFQGSACMTTMTTSVYDHKYESPSEKEDNKVFSFLYPRLYVVTI